MIIPILIESVELILFSSFLLFGEEIVSYASDFSPFWVLQFDFLFKHKGILDITLLDILSEKIKIFCLVNTPFLLVGFPEWMVFLPLFSYV